jgi:hypothetical protein
MAGLIARVASILAVLAGIVAGIFLVFGPTYTGCRSPTIYATGEVIGTETCRTASMWELQGFSGFPAAYGFILLWSLAPLLSLIAAWLVTHGPERIILASLALAIDASVLISFGAAPLYLPLVLPLVFITWLAVYLDKRPVLKQPA